MASLAAESPCHDDVSAMSPNTCRLCLRAKQIRRAMTGLLRLGSSSDDEASVWAQYEIFNVAKCVLYAQSSQFVVPIEPAMDWLGRLFEMMPMRTGAQRCFYGAPSRINQGPKVR
jgi:hypothetical protein